MNLIEGVMKYGCSPHAVTPPRRGEDKSSNTQYGEHPYPWYAKVQKLGILYSDTLRVFRFPRSVTAKFVGLNTNSIKNDH